jgi:hypothetical protein
MTEERRVWIAQCLCPQRHCIMATAGEAENRRAAEATVGALLRANVKAKLLSGEFNPWCGLCHAAAESWRYEVARSRFRSMAEATPALKESEGQQQVTRALWGGMRRSD